ncbi:hypothetical protein GOV12_03210, partial [Candidatus Pacearchaeota archaeon]|nr:hypothetical protein [Candidatus Pacearchaeota archaeon]
MGRKEQIIGERKKKLDEIRKMGINPYPHNFDVSDYSDDLKKKHKKLKDNQRTNNKAVIAGRVMT